MSLHLVTAPRVVASVFFCAIPALGESAVEEPKQNYRLPRGDASTTLRQFAETSGRQIIFMMDKVRGELTNAIDGEFSPREALERMLAGTALVAVQDNATKGFVIKRSVKPSEPSDDPEAQPKITELPRSVRRNGLLALLVGWIGLGLAPADAARASDGNPAGPATQAQGRGTLRGTVFNGAAKVYLDGARVVIRESGAETFSDRDGFFEFPNVLTGSYTIDVSYVGLDPATRQVSIEAGRTIQLAFELTSSIYTLEKFTVAGIREGTAAAIAQQQAALNAKSVVSADTFGDIPDGNVGDFLQKLPGVYSESVGSNVRSFVVRGINSGLSSVTMDGTKLADSQSGNLGRKFELDAVSLTNLDQIEVVKAPTPDMEADSIGGSVNLVTKSAFRQRERVISYSLGAVTQIRNTIGHQDRFGKMGSFQFADTFGKDRRLGIVFATSFHHQPGGGAEVEQVVQAVATSPAYTTRVGAPEADGVPITRSSGSLKFEYKLRDATILGFGVIVNEFVQLADTRRFQYNAAAAAILPGYTDLISEARPAANTTATLFTNVNDKVTRKFGFNPSLKHREGAWRFDGDVSFSVGQSRYTAQPKNKGIYNATLANIGWRVDRTNNLEFPSVAQTAGPDIYSLNNWRGLDFTFQERFQKETIVGTQANVRRDFGWGSSQATGYVKIGAKYRSQERNRDYNGRRYVFAGPNGIVGDSDDGLEKFRDLRDQNFRTGGYRPPPWLDPRLIANSIATEGSQWQEDVANAITYHAQNTKNIREEVTAAYAMGSFAYKQLSVLAGARFEETTDKGTGLRHEITPAEATRRAAFTGPLTPDEIRRRTNAEYSGRNTNSASYRHMFPGVHLRFDLTKAIVLRASVTNSIGRPDFSSIIPDLDVNYNAQTVTLSNTNLKPQYSRNYDLSAEYYLQPSGLLSIGVFRKDIRDFIFSTRGTRIPAGADNGYDGQYAGFELISSANGGSAEVKGLEIGYMQQLSFLRSWLKGLGAYANFTRLITKGNYGGAAELGSDAIAGFMPKTGNLGLSYVGFGADVRLQANWRPNFLQSFSAAQISRIYNYATTTLDVKLKYSFRPSLSLFCDMDNITDEPAVARYRGLPERPSDVRYDGPKVSFGVSGRF